MVFRNISYTGEGLASPSVIHGYDGQRGVRNVRIENLVIAGRRAKDAAGADLSVGDFVEGVHVE